MAPSPQPQQHRPYDRLSYLLVVDDDNTFLKFFKIHLNKFFSKVIVVKNGAEAMATLKEKSIDLVITDMIMPKINGFQLMKKVRRHDLTIPVLMVTGADLDDKTEVDLETADGFLRKPFTIDQLHAFIEMGMDRRRLLKELGEIVEDKKLLRKLLTSRVKLERAIKPKHVRQVSELIKALSA